MSSGKKYEKAVAELHKLFGKEAEISTNSFIEDNFGIKREFDVVIKAKVNGYNIVGLIECKDHNRKIDVHIVDAFAKKSESVNANFKVIFAKKGFSKNALILAEKYGIKAHSLVDNENKELSVKVYLGLYAKGNKFYHVSGNLDTVKDLKITKPLFHNIPLFRKRSLFDLTCKQLVASQGGSREIEPGSYHVSVTVPEGVKRYTSVEGRKYLLQSFEFTVNVNCEFRVKPLKIDSKGIYDWHTNQMSFPSVENNFATEGFRIDDISTWEVCNEIPKEKTLRFIIISCPYVVENYKESLSDIGNFKINKI